MIVSVEALDVSVEILEGLERKLTVAVPAESVNEQISSRLKKLARTAKIDGFRPGKAPLNIVKKNYLNSIHVEVANDLIRSTLYQAMDAKKLNPAGIPDVEPMPITGGNDAFTYHATLEVYPEIEIKELDKDKVEIIKSEVSNEDVEKMIGKLLEQNKSWSLVERAVADGDKIVFDFEGFVDGEAFDGGSAKNHGLVIGEGKMIPGFEAGIIGAEVGKEIEVKVTFPTDYGSEELSGKDAIFKITVKEVKEGQLPELTDEFAKEKFNIKEGGVEAFKKDIKANMERQLERQVASNNREAAFNELASKNPIAIPKALIDKEIGRMSHELYHRIFGNEHHENETIPDFPKEIFMEEATKRVHLGLLFSEYIDKHKIEVDSKRVDTMIEKFAEAYENPDELRAAYKNNKDRMADLSSLVIEEMVAEKILESADVVEKVMDYESVVNPEK